MQQTISATPLDAVCVARRGEVTDVWLRRNITHDHRDEPDGTAQEFWTADEAYGTLQGVVTAQQVAEDFDRLWTRFELAGLSGREYAERLVGESRETMDGILGVSASRDAPCYVAEGELFIAGGKAYVALQNIASGERLIERVNVKPTTVTEYIMAQGQEKE